MSKGSRGRTVLSQIPSWGYVLGVIFDTKLEDLVHLKTELIPHFPSRETHQYLFQGPEEQHQIEASWVFLFVKSSFSRRRAGEAGSSLHQEVWVGFCASLFLHL